jgi:hypothetical protein
LWNCMTPISMPSITECGFRQDESFLWLSSQLHGIPATRLSLVVLWGDHLAWPVLASYDVWIIQKPAQLMSKDEVLDRNFLKCKGL